MKQLLETWKPVKDLEDYYEISNIGRLKSKSRIIKTGKYMIERFKEEKIISPRIVRNYYYGMLDISNEGFRYRKNKSIHRLVAENFIENPNNLPQVNHKDGDKLNNNVENLEWCTQSQNINHSYKIGLRTTPRGNQKFKRKKIDKVFKLRNKGLFHKEIAKILGMGVSTVTHILLKTRRIKQ